VVVSEQGPAQHGSPVAARLRGPWTFGLATLDDAAALLGSPARRGLGYLQYTYAEGRLRVTLLFSAGRLDTIVLEPSDSRDQVRLAEPLPDSSSSTYYVDQAVYIQRLTREVRNPPAVRGVQPAGAARPARQPGQLAAEYDRLAAHFRQALRLREQALGAGHTAVEFLRFELGRLQLGASGANEGRRLIGDALATLAPRLGADHPDVEAMRSWLRKES
jgi:hypothetical protein